MRGRKVPPLSLCNQETEKARMRKLRKVNANVDFSKRELREWSLTLAERTHKLFAATAQSPFIVMPNWLDPKVTARVEKLLRRAYWNRLGSKSTFSTFLSSRGIAVVLDGLTLVKGKCRHCAEP